MEIKYLVKPFLCIIFLPHWVAALLRESCADLMGRGLEQPFKEEAE
jgi:hypothetical protein